MTNPVPPDPPRRVRKRRKKRATPSAPAEEPQAASSTLTQQRLQRLDDFERSAVELPDPLQSVLRGAQADLQRIGYQLGHSLTAALQTDADPTVTQAKDLVPAIETLLKVSRQADRFANLEQRQIENRQASERPRDDD